MTIGRVQYMEYSRALVIPKNKQVLGIQGNVNYDVHVSILVGAESYGTTGVIGSDKVKLVRRNYGQRGELTDPFDKVAFVG